MLIDRLMPEFDATRIEHRVVAGRASEAYAAAVGVDFVDAVRQSHALRGLLALRTQTERLASVLRRSGSAVTSGGPEALRLADLPEQGEWCGRVHVRLTRQRDGRSGVTGGSLRRLSEG
jgi:hypothetical protein